jgi:ribose transport system permease protein
MEVEPSGQASDGAANSHRGTHRPRALSIRPLEVHSLLIVAVLLFAVFSLLKPSTFPSAFNIRSILGTQSVTALVALAVMMPLAAGQYDLSVGYMLGLTHVLVVGLLVKSGLAWPLAIIIAIPVGGLVGLVNGLLVTRVKINSFIATLATGYFVFGVTNWYTNGVQVAGILPKTFTDIANAQLTSFFPLPALFVLIVAGAMYIVLEYLPSGRRLYALGANPRAAELLGVPGDRYVIVSFVIGGCLVGVAGAILAAQLQAGQPDLGPEYLLPAFVGALLGATSVRPGRVNVWGTILAVLLLAIGIAGLQQLGANFYVSYLFDGGTLAVAVGLAGFAARRRVASGTSHSTASSTEDAPERRGNSTLSVSRLAVRARIGRHRSKHLKTKRKD